LSVIQTKGGLAAMRLMDEPARAGSVLEVR